MVFLRRPIWQRRLGKCTNSAERVSTTFTEHNSGSFNCQVRNKVYALRLQKKQKSQFEASLFPIWPQNVTFTKLKVTNRSLFYPSHAYNYLLCVK